MEIGSFIELEFAKERELYNGINNTARLNTGRAGLWHAFRLTGARSIWLPVYQCRSVREFFIKKGVPIKYYHIDSNFTPIDIKATCDDAVLLVNYYGIMSHVRMTSLAEKYNRVIIDNCQAFFSKPIEGVYNVYSCRKFFGVADGAYVIGPNACDYTYEYEQSYSSDTSLFLLLRIEYGCEGKSYEARTTNENRLDSEDVKKMSTLTRTILDGTRYDEIKYKRRTNFKIAHSLFSKQNMINACLYYDSDTVPMVYPLAIENNELMNKLFEAKHFQGRWWKYICDENASDTFEYWLSHNVIPITIDQRYGERELHYLHSIINQFC